MPRPVHRSTVSPLDASRQIASDDALARLADSHGGHFFSNSIRRRPPAIGGRRRDDQDEHEQHETDTEE